MAAAWNKLLLGRFLCALLSGEEFQHRHNLTSISFIFQVLHTIVCTKASFVYCYISTNIRENNNKDLNLGSYNTERKSSTKRKIDARF